MNQSFQLPQVIRRVRPCLVIFASATLLLTASCDKKASDEEQAQNANQVEQGADAAPTEPAPVAVATVDGDIVMSQAELSERMAALVERYERASGQRETTKEWRNARRRRLVHEAVHHALIGKLIDEMGVTVSDAQLEESLRAQYPYLFLTDDTLQRYLTAQGIERDEFFEEHRRQIAVERILEQRGRLEPGEEELRAVYERSPERWRAVERAQAHAILYRISMSSSPEEAAAIAQRLKDDTSDIETIEQFEAFAREHSAGMTASDGGALGWIFKGRSRGPSGERMDTAIFESELNVVTEPVRTSLGTQVFFVTERRPEGIREFDEVKSVLAVPMKRRRIQELRLQLINELRQQHDIEYLDDNWQLEEESVVGSDEEEAPGSVPAP